MLVVLYIEGQYRGLMTQSLSPKQEEGTYATAQKMQMSVGSEVSKC